ncbi:hypothetical protein [Nonomuraea polychroma]|uniref:hypothetical protein n=1 Tax=Nonomuraea polychroma TaxID=46176 RepID=UPI0026D8DA4C
MEDLDLRLDDEHVRIHGKGGSVRTVLLDDRGYVALLKRYLARAGYTAGPLLRASINGRGGPLSRRANLFPDATPVQVRHPLAEGDEDDASWPWLPGQVLGMVAQGEWKIVVTDDRLVEGLDADGNPVYPVCRRAAEAIRLRWLPRSAVPSVP